MTLYSPEKTPLISIKSNANVFTWIFYGLMLITLYGAIEYLVAFYDIVDYIDYKRVAFSFTFMYCYWIASKGRNKFLLSGLIVSIPIIIFWMMAGSYHDLALSILQSIVPMSFHPATIFIMSIICVIALIKQPNKVSE